MDCKSISGKKLKVERSKNRARHLIAGCHSLERRQIQAAVRGQIRQPGRLIEELLEESHPHCRPDFDVLSMVVNGRVFC